MLWRSAVVVVFTAVSLWFLAAILPGFEIDRAADALLAGFVVGVLNAVVWPALASLVVPLSVLTLGIGAILHRRAVRRVAARRAARHHASTGLLARRWRSPSAWR